MRHRVAATAAVLSLAVLTGCGASQLSTPASTSHTAPPQSSSPSASAAAAVAPGLFAVLEGHNPQDPKDHDQVVIVGPDGYARARASFTPRPNGEPAVCDAATWIMPEAYVADGAVYFVDAGGVVRRLQPDGSVTTVASFPFDAHHQVFSFAVSPDGLQIMATIFTVPAPVPNGAPGCGALSSAWMLDTYHDNVGAAPVRVNHVSGMPAYTGSSGGFQDILLVGWDSGGPVAAVGVDDAVQDIVYPGEIVSGGQLSRLDTSGNVLGTLGGAGCSPFSAPVADNVICTQETSDQIGVRRVDGTVLWTDTRTPGDYPVLGSLSPDGTELATEHELVQLSTGAARPLPSAFDPVGWIDSSTILGRAGNPTASLAVVGTSNLGVLTQWGFQATFVGRL